MKIELDFIPDVIVHIRFERSDFVNVNVNVWGDEKIYEYAKEHIHSLMDFQDGFFMTRKGLGVFKIIHTLDTSK